MLGNTTPHTVSTSLARKPHWSPSVSNHEAWTYTESLHGFAIYFRYTPSVECNLNDDEVEISGTIGNPVTRNVGREFLLEVVEAPDSSLMWFNVVFHR